jgi:hypothetical protein
MREAQVKLMQANGLGSRRRGSVEADDGFPARVWEHLDVAPGDAADSSAENFHYRLFGGKSRCQLRQPASAEGDLQGGVDAIKEALFVALEHSTHSGDLDDVDAHGVLGHARPRANRCSQEGNSLQILALPNSFQHKPLIGRPADVRLKAAKQIRDLPAQLLLASGDCNHVRSRLEYDLNSPVWQSAAHRDDDRSPGRARQSHGAGRHHRWRSKKWDFDARPLDVAIHEQQDDPARAKRANGALHRREANRHEFVAVAGPKAQMQPRQFGWLNRFRKHEERQSPGPRRLERDFGTAEVDGSQDDAATSGEGSLEMLYTPLANAAVT